MKQIDPFFCLFFFSFWFCPQFEYPLYCFFLTLLIDRNYLWRFVADHLWFFDCRLNVSIWNTNIQLKAVARISALISRNIEIYFDYYIYITNLKFGFEIRNLNTVNAEKENFENSNLEFFFRFSKGFEIRSLEFRKKSTVLLESVRVPKIRKASLFKTVRISKDPKFRTTRNVYTKLRSFVSNAFDDRSK